MKESLLCDVLFDLLIPNVLELPTLRCGCRRYWHVFAEHRTDGLETLAQCILMECGLVEELHESVRINTGMIAEDQAQWRNGLEE